MRVISYSDYVDTPRRDVEWLVDNLIPRPGMVELIGAPKAGKTFITLDLALAVARGAPFMGHATKQSRVLYFQLDTSEHIMRDRGEKLRRAGVDIAAPLFGMVHPDDTMRPVNIMLQAGTDYVKTALRQFDPALVIIDTLRECHQEDENESTAMKAVMDQLERLFTGRSLFLVHHINKIPEDVDRPDPVRSSRGSSYITGKVDAFWLLYKHRLSITSRWDEDTSWMVRQAHGGMFT